MICTATNSMSTGPTFDKKKVKTLMLYDTLQFFLDVIYVLFSPFSSILAVSLQEKIAAFDSCTFTKKFFVTSKKIKHMHFN